MFKTLIALSIAVSTVPAQAFLADNNKRVSASATEGFEVAWSGRSGASEFWCAAGDYVLHDLRLPPATRIYRYDPPIRGGGEPIRFGFDPAQAAPTGLIRIQGGMGVQAAHAYQFCDR